MNKKLISIVIPVYNEEVFLETYYARLKRHINEKGYEVIFVNDGSTDYTIRILQKIADENLNVKIVTLAKNYGKQIAVTAGMQYAKGDAVIVVSVKDGEPYAAIEELANAHFKGAEIVRGYYDSRQNSVGRYDDNRYFFIRIWAGFKDFLLKAAMHAFGVRGRLVRKPDIELYDRKVVDIINALPEKNLLLRRTDNLFGYKTAQLSFRRGVISASERQIFVKRKEELDDLRKSEALGEPAKYKRRLYATSLWISYGAFVTLGVFLILAFVLSTLHVNFVWIFFSCFFAAVSIFISVMFLARAHLIKLLGILYFLKKDEKLFEIKSLVNF